MAIMIATTRTTDKGIVRTKNMHEYRRYTKTIKCERCGGVAEPKATTGGKYPSPVMLVVGNKLADEPTKDALVAKYSSKKERYEPVEPREVIYGHYPSVEVRAPGLRLVCLVCEHEENVLALNA